MICEYVGEARIELAIEKDETEYVWLQPDDLGRSIVIDSTFYANEARLIAGIPKKFKKNTNCIFLRVLVDGLARAFVISTKEI